MYKYLYLRSLLHPTPMLFFIFLLFLSNPTQSAKVAIIGGGMSGLSAAYTIAKGDDGKQNGWKVDVFEATNRLGGRVWSGTLCTTLNDGSKPCQTIEYGGEFIDSGHTTVLSYVKKFQLTLEDKIGCEAPKGFKSIPLKCAKKPSTSSPTGFLDENNNILLDTEPVYSVLNNNNDSVTYTATEAQDDWFTPGKPKDAKNYVTKDTNDADYPTNFNLYTSVGQMLDQMSLQDYLDNLGDKGVPNKLIQLLRVAYVGEFGMEVQQQSSLNMLYLLGYAGKTLSLFGESDERYHVVGGNEQLIVRLKNEIEGLGNTINMNHRLLKIERLTNGKYRLTFDHPMSKNNNTKLVVIYDRVVLAIPFSVMRKNDPLTGENLQQKFGWSVDISNAGFSALKMTAINQLPMGRNAKVTIQYNKRFWRPLGFSGETYATAYKNNKETNYQNTWETTIGQPGQTGILVNYVSGNKATSVANSLSNLWWDPNVINNTSAVKANVKAIMEQIDEVLPGADKAVNFSGFQLNNSNCDLNNSKGCELYKNVLSVNWTKNPYSRGSYAGYAPGQNTSFAGFEPAAEPCIAPDPSMCLDVNYQLIQRNVHFAGEHTAYDFIGYIEGAAVSGQRAGNEVRAALELQNVPVDFP